MTESLTDLAGRALVRLVATLDLTVLLHDGLATSTAYRVLGLEQLHHGDLGPATAAGGDHRGVPGGGGSGDLITTYP